MIPIFRPLLACALILILSACASPRQLEPAPYRILAASVISSPSSTALLATSTPASSPSLTPTAPPPAVTPIPTETVTPTATLPPAGVFAIKFYPPLVLDYSPNRWTDRSEYNNTEMMVNTLQYQELKTCAIGPMGPSGFYPDNMKTITLGSITYQVLDNDKSPDGKIYSYYFAVSSTAGSIDNEIGIVHFAVQSDPAEASKCKDAAEEVLATLRPASQPKHTYCQLLEKRYQPPAGFQTYCDPNYPFAFDYPADWQTAWISSSSDRPGSNPLWVRSAVRFFAPDGSDYVRTDTYHLYDPAKLPDRADSHFSGVESEFPGKEYPSLKMGGQRAYARIYRWQQDISAVYLFFQHGDYYTILELKAPSRAALDLNWKIAASVQVPGAAPEDNYFPPELIDDSYTLTANR